jgi:hypothetical protein
MPLGEFQENMHLREGLPLKRNGSGNKYRNESHSPRFAFRFGGLHPSVQNKRR